MQFRRDGGLIIVLALILTGWLLVELYWRTQ